MIIKKADIFTPGCCFGHYNSKREECKSECDLAEFCKKSVVSGQANKCKAVMKKKERNILECVKK